jgi:cell division transport system ATP-binding protein
MYHFPNQLSGGEKQRLAIARAIINQPEVLIADEPTGNLDEANTHEVIHILKKINDLGTTVILTTHDPLLIKAVGTRLVTMQKGRIVDDQHRKVKQEK